MSMIHSPPGLRRTAARIECAAYLCWRLWTAFQERRRCRQVTAVLSGLSDRELMDIGTTRGEIDYVAAEQGIVRPHRPASSRADHVLIAALLCIALPLAFAGDAEAQCSARDVLRNQLGLKTAAPARRPPTPVGSAADVPVWKTIATGTFPDSFALRNAMDAIGCGAGGLAEEILARPAFTLGTTKAEVGLVTLSAAELGFEAETATLGRIYARAQQLGFELAPAEVAAQLRLQYLDQPIGEFLIIAMEPIRTWEGEPVILTVANGGAGLILIGQDGGADAEISATSLLVFVRPGGAAPAEAAFTRR